MIRRTFLLLPMLASIANVPFADGQEVVNKGVLVPRILARTRFGVFERGDLVHVTVRQPAGDPGYTISVHAEYADARGQWRQVPPPTTPLAMLYTSGNYGGLRDYVDVEGVSPQTERNIAMFMPFNGFSLEQGKDYNFRYVIRLWKPRVGKRFDQELINLSLSLQPYRIHVGKDKDGIIITAVDLKPCRFLVDSSEKGAPASTGIVRFFDSKSGKWSCPDDKPAATASVPLR